MNNINAYQHRGRQSQLNNRFKDWQSSFKTLYDDSVIVRSVTIMVVGIIGLYAIGFVACALTYATKNINSLSLALQGATA